MVGCFSHNSAGQGNFDRAQFRQDQLDRYRDRLEVKSDDDWKKIEPLIGKVMDAQREARMGMGGFGFGFGGRGGRGGGDAGGTGDQANTNTNRNRGRQSNSESEELQKAIDDKAPADEIKAKVAKLREARKAKEAALAKTQEELRQALSPRQEAGAIIAGLLK